MNVRVYFFVIVLSICFVCSAKVFAIPAPPYPKFDDLLGEIQDKSSAKQQSDQKNLQNLPFSSGLSAKFINDNPELKKKFIEYLNTRFQREIDKSVEQKASIAFSKLSSYMILIFIHIVFAVGLWAATKEILHAGKTRKRSSEQHELMISLEGIALKTSLHGTILLVLSIVLYFLFLKFVYPIVPI